MATILHNQVLKETLEVLTQKTFAYYNGNGLSSSHITDPIQISIFLHTQEDNVKQLDEYKTCVEHFHADPKIRSLLGNSVGTLMERSTIGNADECIMSFISQLYLENKMFDAVLFHNRYEEFEELFYSDKLRFIDTVRLHNFNSEMDQIEIGEGLVIKRSSPVQNTWAEMEEARYRPYTRFSKSDFLIERTYAKTKLVGLITTEPDSEQMSKEANESGDLFDMVVKTLRILKASAVFRDTTVTTEYITFFPHAGITSRTPFQDNAIIGNKCVLSSQEAQELKVLFEKIKQDSNQTFKISSNRLVFGLEKRFDEDRLLDYMIGLEALYLPDGNQELTFRLSLRVALMIAQEKTERKDLFQFIKQMYHQRSNTAHGSSSKKNTLTKDNVIKIEEILRTSLKMYLDDPNWFTEGNLNNIFFQ